MTEQKIKITRYPEADISPLSDLTIHPILKRVYINRGINSSDDLEADLSGLLPYHDLKDVLKAAEILAEAIKSHKRICVVGDYDVDGATSVVLMLRALRALGAVNVQYIIPDRFLHGYGLTPEIAELAIQKKAELIVTVDNGMASISGVQAAKAAGIPVIITDHHLPADELPEAAAIVNPNQIDDVFPGKNLAGVGVAFYVLLALRAELRNSGWFEQQGIQAPNFAQYLDLVALGTVADLVRLDKNNRLLVQQGLCRIRAGHCLSGIKALLKLSRRSFEKITASDIGYAIAPRLNAAGRLDDMSLGVECLLADKADEAMRIAGQLDMLNDERKKIEESMRFEAFRTLKQMQSGDAGLPKAVCVFDKNWHAGVLGVLASRIKDNLQRPVIAFALQKNDELKGSARSVEGLHIRNVLKEIAQRHPNLIVRFGGHAMAAGLSLKKAAYDDFVRFFNEAVARRLELKPLKKQILSDGELEAGDFNLELAEALKYALPWGMGFEEPLFDGRFQVLDQRLLKERHLKLILKHAGQLLTAIAFNVDADKWPNERCDFVHLAYHLDINEYLGRRSIQLLVRHIEAV